MTASTARLFIAAYPPRAIARALLDRLKELPGLPDHRLVGEADVHLTIYFVGARPREHVPLLARGVQAVVRPYSAFTLAVDRLMTIPQRRPRLIAAAARPSEPLTQLNHDLSRLFEERAPSGTSRMDLPHLTLCRFKRGSRAATIDQPIDPVPFEVSRIRLVESVLGPSGAVHAIQESFDLGPAGATGDTP